MLLALLAAAAVTAAAAEPPAAPATDPAAGTTVAPVTATAPRSRQDQQLICRTETETGSHRRQKVCYRKAEKEAQDFLSRQGSRDSVNSQVGGGAGGGPR